MTDHILSGVYVKTPRHGGELTLSFDEATWVLTVDYFRQERGDYSPASETRHFRLVEVHQVWEQVNGG